MSSSENYAFCVDGVEDLIANLPMSASAEELARAVEVAGYYVTDEDTIFVGHDEFFEKLFEDRNETEQDIEQD
jgi:hypothetical protein